MSDTNQALSLQIIDKEFPIDKFNRIMPTTTHLQDVLPYHKASIETLAINPDPDQKEVFKLATIYKNGKTIPVLSLTKLALDKIGNILGIEWEHDKCRRTDDRSDPNIIEFSAVGRVKKFDGTWMPLTGTKQIDVNAYVDEHRYKCEENVLGKYGWKYNNVEYKGRDALNTPECQDALDRSSTKRRIDVSKHKLALAESGAKNRAIRSFGIKSTYTPDELKNPFAVLHLHIDHKAIAADPTAKKAVLQSAIGADNLLFNDTPSSVKTDEKIQDADFADVSTTNIEQEKDTEKTSDPDAATLRVFQEAEFKSFDAETRYEALVRMIKKNKVTVEGKPMNLDRENFLDKDVKTQLRNMMWTYDKIHPIETAEFPD